MDRGVGKWILPQPDNRVEYIPIPMMGTLAPFGYKIDEEREGWLIPIQSELDALEKAKKHLKQYGLRAVAAWLSTATGRPISHAGLNNRLKYEQSYKRRAKAYRKLAEGYKEALRKAEAYERRANTTTESYFNSDEYSKIRNTFSDDSDRANSCSAKCNIQA